MGARNQCLEVWGELACFTRPELKVERFSYPFITPSAARGIFDAIYCKPTEFRWQVVRIEILSPVNYIALRRNEVKEKISVPAVSRSMAANEPPDPIWADADRDFTGNDTRGRTQRQTMALKNVRYRLHAEIRPWPGFEDRQSAFESQFRRRAASGKCFYQPYFGCREFPAFFRLIEKGDPLPPPIDISTEDIGLMLYDVFDLSRPGGDKDIAAVSLFRPIVKNGVVDVPSYDDTSVLKGLGRTD